MDKNIRIAIIGGGPAGLSAGMYLEQKGEPVLQRPPLRDGRHHGRSVLLRR